MPLRIITSLPTTASSMGEKQEFLLILCPQPTTPSFAIRMVKLYEHIEFKLWHIATECGSHRLIVARLGGRSYVSTTQKFP
jgi:hypothetical protein